MSEQTSHEVSSAPSEARSRGPGGLPCGLWAVCACALMVLTVLILPLPLTVRALILGVLILAPSSLRWMPAVGVRSFAAMTCALLTLYLAHIAQQGFVMLASGLVAGIVLGAGMILLPILGAWALVREVLFGARIQRMARELAASNELVEDNLRTLGRVWTVRPLAGGV